MLAACQTEGLPSVSADDRVRAASRGSIPRLVWLRRLHPPCPWTSDALVAAAQKGHLHVVKHLHLAMAPCPWSIDVCTAAAGGGHLEMLKWVRANGCPWGLETFEAAFHGR